MATYTFLQGATGAMQIAGNFSGVPFAGAVATIVAGIVETTRQVQVHRVSVAITLDLLITRQPTGYLIRGNAAA